MRLKAEGRYPTHNGNGDFREATLVLADPRPLIPGPKTPARSPALALEDLVGPLDGEELLMG
jgi:hypothetical protein